MKHAAIVPRRYPIEAYDDALPRGLAQAQARTFLIGMQHMLHDEDFGAPPMQAMRVIMVLPGAAAHARAPAQEPARIALDTLPLHARAPHGLRAIEGQVLRDALGRLYERRGDATRALGRVVAGPHGRLFEQLEVDDVEVLEADAPSRSETDPPYDAAPDFAREVAQDSDPAAPSRATAATRSRSLPMRRSRRPSREPDANCSFDAPLDEVREAGAQARSPVRALLPAPGKWVQVRFGEFEALLQRQLAHPRRIAADYEIGAYLQVFDSTRALEPEEVSRWVFGDEHHADAFAPWTTALARRLGITLGSHASPGTEASEPRRIAAGQRFFALRIAADPTTASSAGVQDEPAAARPRRAIPPALLCAVAPSVARAQAIALMQHPPRSHWWRRWTTRVGAAARHAWQKQLAGRTLDEQLWSVAPPAHGLADAAVREWAHRTLRLAGYELPRMVDEWEIFWRCRGATD